MKSKKIALVLSSGGARGLAQIGVIEELEKEGFEISSVSGSSIGALIGALYAADQLDVYKEWICKLDRLDVFNLLDFNFGIQGFVKGEKVFDTLKKFIPDQNIEDFKIPFAAVATDARSKQEIVFDKGSMYRALRASTAIPSVVTPLYSNNMELIDGGVLNPIPVEHIRRLTGDMLAIVNVSSNNGMTLPKQTKEEENSYFKRLNSFFDRWGKLLPGSSTAQKKLGFLDIINRSIDLMQDRISELSVREYNPDLIVNISRDACTTFEFYRAEELIELGRKAAQIEIQKLQNESTTIEQRAR